MVDIRSTSVPKLMRIEISLLGAVAATSAGEPVELGPPQQRALLALLALRAGSVLPVDTVVDTLWPEDPPPSAHKIVQTYVSRLRKTLGQKTIERRGSGYALNADGVTVDVARFEELIQDGRLNEALGLWRGPALADVVGPPVLRQEAERLEELRLWAVEERIDDELAAGRTDEVVADLRRLVATHPFRERLIGRLMLALYGSGRQAEALEVYRAARTMLVDELGIEPGAELKELERRMLDQDPTLRPRAEATRISVTRPKKRLRIAALAAVVVASAAVVIPLALGHGGRTVVPAPNSIVRIDPRTNKVVQDIHVGREPSGIAATQDAVWVANERDRTLSRFDTHTHAIQTIGGLNGVGFVTRDAHGNVYASGWDYPFVWRIDPRAVALAATYRIRSRAVGMAVGGGSLWVVDRLVNSIARIDLRHDRVVDSIKVGADPLVTAFGFGALWVANSDDATVSVVRPGTRATQTIPVGAKPFGIAAGEGAVWVSSNSDATLTRIDPEVGRVTKVIHMPAQPDALYNVAVGAGSVWVADVGGLQVIRIDPRTNKVVARIKLGVEPRVIAVTGDNVWVSVAPPGTT